MRYKKARPGDDLEFPAALQNDLIDLVGGNLGNNFADSAGMKPHIVKVKNVTGRDLRQFAGFRLGNSLWQMLPADTTRLGQDIFELSDNSVRTNRPVAVLQQPLAIDAIGDAAVSGVTLVRMRIVSSSDPAFLPRNYMGIMPSHHATQPDSDGAFVPDRMGGDLQLISPVIAGVGADANSALACFAMARFVERGLMSQQWKALTDAGVDGVSEAVGGIAFTTSLPDAHIAEPDLNYYSEFGPTGWQTVDVSGLPTGCKGWRCKRPGVWRIVTTAFCKTLVQTVAEFTSQKFGLRVSLFGGTTRNREHMRTSICPPQSSYPTSNEETVSWVDYFEVKHDDVLTLRPWGESRKVTSFTNSSANSQAWLGMRGNLSAELVTPHYSTADRTPQFIEVPPEE